MTQIISSPEAGRILRWWTRLSPLPAGRQLFSLGLGWIAPYSASIGALVEVLEPGHARVSLKDRRRVRNHLHSVHALALLNLGEIATGLAVLSRVSANMRGIVVSIHADYLKKARGRLTAIADFHPTEPLADNTTFEVEALLKDQAGETVTVVRATWLIGNKTP